MATQNKSIQVLARYFVKLTFAVVYLVRNGSAKEYLVTLNANGTSGCVEAATDLQCEGCKHGHACYHKLAVMSTEGLRGVHLKEHGSLAGFRFVAPVEKKARAFERPTTVEQMNGLRVQFERTRSKDLREALGVFFESMRNECGEIVVGDKCWGYDVDIQALFEIVPALSPDCGPAEVILPGLPAIEEAALNNEPLNEEEFSDDVVARWTKEALAGADEALRAPVISASKVLPQAPKWSTPEQRERAPLNGNHGFRGVFR
jgi:hypothetical protein